MFGSSSLQGRRKYQQDALCVGELLMPGYRIFGIYDGHGGRGGGRCSRLAATKLTQMIRDNLISTVKLGNDSLESIGESMVQSFRDFDHYLKSLPPVDETEKRRKPLASLIFGLPSAKFDDSGSCACVVLSTPDGFVVANLGDSRAILSNGKRITNDHTALSVTELERIYAEGGIVAGKRVFGILSPSRAFGDFKLKSADLQRLPVSHIPEIHIIRRSEELPRYIVIMCDGIHNVLRDKEIATFCEKYSSLHPNDLADCITGEAFKRQSKDNLSCIVLRTFNPSGSTVSLSSLDEPKLIAYSTASDEHSDDHMSDFDSDEEEKACQ